ncbi:MAG TPA: SUMF1/EgtB/PvdO family nonheme iron enzyme [Anaerolineales bacterium]|jgi:formylglycine-generating enzyme required for sulfatase activity|nr:SUMF1/EgtB/PvdO family nonheme iron enzyme [Anaerolineales bacterium]
MKIFISYRRKDSAREVGRIRDRLKAAFGEQSVFRDLVDIPAGVDFRTVLERETKGCDVMLVVIGTLWAGITDDQGNKRLFKPEDWTRIEVETGLQRLQEGTVRVFPILVLNAAMPSPGELPETLQQLPNQNAISIHDDPYFDFDMDRLIRDIRNSGSYHPVEKLEYFEPETVYIPEGPFWMGSEPREGVPIHETPRHEVDLPAYCIGKYPVTNRQYEEFIIQTHTRVMPVMGWDGQRVPRGLEQYPVSGVTWYEARTYCDWLSKATERDYSLPNEAQWEKACRGGNDCTYPWGDDVDPARSNQGKSQMASVDAYPPQNEYEIFDLVGNVRQWTVTLWGEKPSTPDFKYPWANDGRNNPNANSQIRRVVRGSSFTEDTQLLRCSARSGQFPENAGLLGTRHGFRVAMKV